jgi:uncharacterized protein
MSGSVSEKRRSAIPVVRIAQLPQLADALAEQLRAADFRPEGVVYIETGARLFAHVLAGALNVPLTPIWVRRGGRSLKRHLAPLIGRLPVQIRDWLRRVEEQSGLHRHTERLVQWSDHAGNVQGMRLLLVDDAADTGRTIELARESVVARSAAGATVRTAVLAATTRIAQSKVDFYVLDCNCRMPWSADSDERDQAEILAAKIAPHHAPRGF